MGKPLRILIVEDTEADMASLLDELRRGGYEPIYERVDTSAAMSAALARQTWDVVVSDYYMPHFSAPATINLLKETGLNTPLIVISSTEGEGLAAEAIRAGARDYIVKSDLARLVPVIDRELQRKDAHSALREAETRYRTLVEHVPAAIHLIALTEESATFSMSPQIEKQLGFSAAEWTGHPELWWSQLHPEDRERVLSELARSRTSESEPFILEYRLIARDGREVWFRDETVVVRDQSGQPQFLQSLKLDITEQKQSQVALQVASERLANWVNEVERRNREITLLNEMGNQLQSCRTIEEANPIIAEFAQQFFPAETGALYLHNASRTSLSAVTLWGDSSSALEPEAEVFAPDECWALRRGRVHWVEDPQAGQICPHLPQPPSAGYLCVPMMAQGEALGVLHLQRRAQGLDHLSEEGLTEAKQRLATTVAEHLALALANLKLREALHLESSRDPLTGLFNRRYLEETLERELRRATRKSRPLGVMMLDLEHFKNFNETYGHDAGDALLREVGKFLQSRVRGEDIACRYGGEDFTLLLPETALEIVVQRGNKLQEEFEAFTFEHRGQLLKGVSLSIGAAAFPEHGSTGEAILRAAEASLALAKAESHDQAEAEQNIPPIEKEDGDAQAPNAESGAEATAKPDEMPPRVTIGSLSLNRETFEITVEDRGVSPTPIEFELLYFLMRHAGKVFTSEQLLQEVWHYPPGTGSHEVVRAHIKNLRSKIEPDPKHPIFLKTKGRFGYTISLEDEHS
jgi:diguanylate cyclase (GGDEF)-like protein/PAS domain S-box-containing protein